MKAIVAHAWRPAPELWGDYKMQKIDAASTSSFEIARIVIVDSPEVDLTALENLAYDHSLCALPLFVLDSKHLQAKPIDFALGLDGDGCPIKCCALDEKTGVVSEQAKLPSYDLIAAFETMLSNPHLKTAQEYVGRQRMWTQRPAELTKKYAQIRKPSALIVGILNKHLPLQAEVGLDLCCGTGNYLAPLKQRFGKVIGLDISPEMIQEAKARVPGVEWVIRDAKDSGQPANSCDAVWMISALHYFRGEEQGVLFREVWRFLKLGGVFLADTEFLEQHPSLWVVDYFPSLRKRFMEALFSQETYRTWLRQAGFNKVEFETYDYNPDELDGFLRIGQHRPALYLDQRIRDGIPAFQLMDPAERAKGLQRLRDEIDTGETARIQQQYASKAQLSGDLGVIIATK
jgi:ubiquinone/menaquinone biosynthesis C-methylase UbiE